VDRADPQIPAGPRQAWRGFYVLIDARHGLKEVDLDVLNTLDKSAVSYQVVLTKADQVKAGELEQTIGRRHGGIGKNIPRPFRKFLVTSLADRRRDARTARPRWCACLRERS